MTTQEVRDAEDAEDLIMTAEYQEERAMQTIAKDMRKRRKRRNDIPDDSGLLMAHSLLGDSSISLDDSLVVEAFEGNQYTNNGLSHPDEDIDPPSQPPPELPELI